MLSLDDRSVSFTLASSLLLWIAGLVLVVVDIFVEPQLVGLGLFSAGAGGVLTIRSYFCALSRREQNAFELGRESAGIRGL